MTSAAELLEGRTLKSGWHVKRKIPLIKNNSQITGGHFSVGYEVEKGGRTVFLKALDFNKAFAADPSDPATSMHRATNAFIFEKNILKMCRKAKVKKVVKLIDDGVEIVDEADAPKKTQYLIFEWAASDMRKEVAKLRIFDHALALRYMHGITSGLYHLHMEQIIHQDIKPSNILLFEKDDIKIADFGRSHSAAHAEVEHNKNNFFPGDNTYAPPECLYGYETGSDETIRKGADVYMLGSMLHFFFTGTALTPGLLTKLHPNFHYTKQHWDRDQILPYLKNAHATVVEEFSESVHEELREEISAVLQQLTDPIPEKRGHPSARFRHESNLSLERYVSAFDRLSRRYLMLIQKR